MTFVRRFFFSLTSFRASPAKTNRFSGFGGCPTRCRPSVLVRGETISDAADLVDVGVGDAGGEKDSRGPESSRWMMSGGLIGESQKISGSSSPLDGGRKPFGKSDASPEVSSKAPLDTEMNGSKIGLWISVNFFMWLKSKRSTLRGVLCICTT